MANLLDRTITWGDASEEVVQIGDDFFFTLAGVKKKLFGLDVTPVNPLCSDPAKTWTWQLPENLTFLGIQLAYLQSIGVRLIRLDISHSYVADHDQEFLDYRALFDLIFSYKILIIPKIEIKLYAGFNTAIKAGNVAGLVIPYTGGDTVAAWLGRLLPIMATYTNIVAVQLDNELDYLTGDMDYTAANVTTYLNYFSGLVKSNMANCLTMHNICDDNTNVLDIKTACLAAVDIPSIDTYGSNATTMITTLGIATAARGITGNWWCMKTGYSGDSTLTTPAIVDASFKSRATVSLLCATIADSHNGAEYFDWYGIPITSLVNLASYLQSLQKIGNLIT
ncbi:MAG: hypothetical protein MUP81_00295 [Dehalococcoidia bacterium]|nr:hypothetical protein [Dehalococcoidia bacterium]